MNIAEVDRRAAAGGRADAAAPPGGHRLMPRLGLAEVWPICARTVSVRDPGAVESSCTSPLGRPQASAMPLVGRQVARMSPRSATVTSRNHRLSNVDELPHRDSRNQARNPEMIKALTGI